MERVPLTAYEPLFRKSYERAIPDLKLFIER